MVTAPVQEAAEDAALARLDDPALPALPVLLREPTGLLDAALAPARGRVRRVDARQATWRPERRLTVRYDARVAWPDGRVTDEMLVATTGTLHPRSLVLEAGDVRVGVWRVPHDPWLPGLAVVTDPPRLDALLDALDVGPGRAEHRIVSYRPGRRAVVRARRAGTTLFVKVTRPDQARAMHDRHVALASAVPVPRSLGVDRALGVVVLQGLGGSLLRHRLAVPGAALPGPEAVLAVLDRLPPPADGARAPGWRAPEWATLLGRVRPDRAEAVRALADEIAAVGSDRQEPLVPVHGDLHEAQLLVQRGRISGVLDVDTNGLGHRVDDLANLIGHLVTLALTSSRRRRVERYAARLLDGFDRTVDPVVLRYAVADVVLGLATGPFRVLEPAWPARTDARIALAQRWAVSARRLVPARSHPTVFSGPPHVRPAHHPSIGSTQGANP
ncbi:MAG: aminoglycoside phosphotransferase family protein [Acidimicrobiales bacterium]